MNLTGQKIMLKIFIMLLTGIGITRTNAQQASVLANDSLPAIMGAGQNGTGLKKSLKLPVSPLFPVVWADRYNVQAKAVPADFATRNWGFFCKQEWQFEKRTGIPFRFRVGSVEEIKK
ncbi:hypothetical protein OI18_10115 [Flavihumibacter solisilvae]|uniref:Uncharacterized protein n=2 Tax=Flavihumibacter solisilvae TaxID=1349421 RepID=A0A0C1L425_9BACT|nr:hypothetical protein OI18_10115 [Flavihumibacter solisilvae]